MKRVGFLIEKIADISNLYDAYGKACRGKYCQSKVKQYSQNLDDNISLLRKQLLNGDIDVGHYHYFTIYDPKKRLICAADFPERILHHAIVNICLPIFDKKLIDTTYATRKGKGIYAALDEAISACTKYEYAVKLDFRKYYDSVLHSVLKQQLRKIFKDGRLLLVFDKIIDSYSVSEGCGIPIGNLTSQYFANTYLSPLDHYVKEQLHAPSYIRYMDDVLIMDNDKERLVHIVKEMSRYASDILGLTLKPPIYRQTKYGQTFLGYKVLPYRCELSGRSKKRFRSKIVKYENYLKNGKWNEQTYQEHVLPLVAFVKHAVSNSFLKSCTKICGDNQRVGLTA